MRIRVVSQEILAIVYASNLLFSTGMDVFDFVLRWMPNLPKFKTQNDQLEIGALVSSLISGYGKFCFRDP